jgi:Predicted secreted (periplasmic) protein
MNGWSPFIRQTTVLCLLLAVGMAVVLLSLKHQVQQLSDELRSLDRQIVAERQSIQVLKAEFAYRTQPDRLRGLATRYLGLSPVEPQQLATFATLDAVLAATSPAPKEPARTAERRTSVHVAEKARGAQR